MVRQPWTALQYVPINCMGYDSSGCYWGVGPRLYWVEWQDASGRWCDKHFRAVDRPHAKRKALALIGANYFGSNTDGMVA